MTPAAQRQRRIFLTVVGAGLIAGLVYDLGRGSSAIGYGLGAVYGLLISVPLALLETFSARGSLRGWVRGLPLAWSLVLRSFCYAAVILVVQYYRLGNRILDIGVEEAERDFWSATVFSVGAALVINFVLEISMIMGPGTLLRFISGRYHTPREEQRFVLFVDVVGSTAAAERLGNLGIHRYLDQVFRLVSGPVLDSYGEIHSYVGDEVIITWTARDGAVDARPLACFRSIRAELTKAAPRFLAEFGLAPQVRGSLHFGTLVTGEIGDLKRGIVFHGDVMNAAARLEAASRDVEGGFIVSQAARARMQDPAGLTKLGALAVRGRSEPVETWRLSSPG